VVDHLDGDLAALGDFEGAAAGGVEAGPGGLVDLGLEDALELVVGVVGAGEVGVADEEALAVVFRVEEPAGDVVGRRAADGAGRRVVDVEAADLDRDFAAAVEVVEPGAVGVPDLEPSRPPLVVRAEVRRSQRSNRSHLSIQPDTAVLRCQVEGERCGF
jgi:hypothetical protein